MTLNESWEVDDVPASAWCRRQNKYGSVPGLVDDELAIPDELERQVFREEFGPVLALPVRGRKSFRPEVDDSGVDFSTFATVDFEQGMPEFDKARYKAEKLREELRDILILFGIVKERLPRVAATVLKYLRMGVIELEHLAGADMLALARLQRRADKLRQEIRQLKEASRAKQLRQAAEMLG